MSIYPEDRDSYVPPNDKNKYIRFWRLEVSKEFIVFMTIIIFAIATSLYNPLLLKEIAQQNNELNKQNLNNTERIMTYLDISNQNDTARGIDLIKVLFLYMQDNQRDIAKIMEELNISNSHFVKVNGTHVITENGTAKLPYIINMSEFNPPVDTNIHLELESIKN